MSRDTTDDHRRTDRPREAEHSAPVRHPERDATHHSSQEPAPTEPTPLFVVDWHRVGWYVLGALVGGGGYGLALVMLIQLVVAPATLVTPAGVLFVLFIGSYLLGLIVLLVRYPRIVLAEAVTAVAILFTASGVVPGYTTVPATILIWFGVACLGPGVLAGGIHLYQRWGRTQRSGARHNHFRR
jgi:fluoride ion exporter CrcB/FEX